MPKKLTDGDKEKIVNEVGKQGEAAQSYGKLNRKVAPLKVPERMALIKDLQSMLKTIEDSKTPKDDKSKQLAEINRELETANSKVIEAVLVPLTAMEMLSVQGFVAEASTSGLRSEFDLDVRLFMIVKAEHCAIVHLATRQKDSPSKRYFTNMDAVVMLDDETLHEIARQYREAFILSEEERKNL